MKPSRHRRRSLQLIAGLAALAAAPLRAQAPVERRALVIGNARYGIAADRLRNPGHDAERLRAALQARGIAATRLTDLTAAQMRDALRGFAQARPAGEGLALVYFAGHAVSVDGVNYLFGVDLPVPVADLTIAEAQRHGISLRLVSQMLERGGWQARVIFVDACRTAMTRGATQPGLARQVPASGELIAYATQPGATAEDGFGGTGPAASPYAFYLAAAITAQAAHAPLEDLLSQVTADVQTATAWRQIPHYESSLVGRVSLDGLTAGATRAVAAEGGPATRGGRPRLAEDLIRQRMQAWEHEIQRGAHTADLPGRQALEARAAVGDVVAMSTLGVLAESGRLAPVDLAQAAAWYADAAAQGYPPAMTYLGELAATGRGIPQDHAYAEQLLDAAARAGHERAALSLLDLRMRMGYAPDAQGLGQAFQQWMRPWVEAAESARR